MQISLTRPVITLMLATSYRGANSSDVSAAFASGDVSTFRSYSDFTAQLLGPVQIALSEPTAFG